MLPSCCYTKKEQIPYYSWAQFAMFCSLQGHSAFTSDGLLLSAPLSTHLTTSNCKIRSRIRCVRPSLTHADTHRLLRGAKAHQTKGLMTFASSGKRRRHARAKPKSTQYVETTGPLWFCRATCHKTGRATKKKYEKILTHFITTWTNQKEPFQTLSWLQKYFFVFL